MHKKQNSLTIKDWSEDDKPREKLVNKGRTVLSDAELIAILIGSGNKKESAVGLSQRILAMVNHNLNELGRLSVHQLKQFDGIGDAKAVTIAAALEIGRRRRGDDIANNSKVNSSKDAFEILFPLIGELEHEEFWILYLNNNNKVVHKALLSKGGITGTLVDVRLVLKKALELGAVALILAHNHPSGSLRSSAADKHITKKLKNASEALDIQVLDHLILTQHGYLSFADKGML
ncbi:DNA repair protein RadC [Muricauda sp. 2012CJ35-5]|uniref:DNA repair protein RadC n=1 Tax=Flagellimonas spongiicola TaxID=2942208 RepID=A0ABT0PM03_9FLAO|nr:DNA repair protein RadC [Allomuricauda spongiicola]MCL6272425.1 DNA repair protein RadC [Allomuricauda spongiicola]